MAFSDFPVVFTNPNMDEMICENIPINDDLLVEGNEEFGVVLSANDPIVDIVGGAETVQIIDDDST